MRQATSIHLCGLSQFINPYSTIAVPVLVGYAKLYHEFVVYGQDKFYLNKTMKLKWNYMINFQVGLLFYLYAVAFFRIQSSGKDLVT